MDRDIRYPEVVVEETRKYKPAVALPVLLFILTILTTAAAGAMYQGSDLIKNPHEIMRGIPFSAALLLILGTHELGHYIASRRHGVATTLPTFIPGPPFPPMIGTFGAVIRIKSPITTKEALVDIGASGPLSGFVVAVTAVAIGLKFSTIIPKGYMAGSLGLGSSLVFKLISYLVLGVLPDQYDIYLHPIAFAGWIGLFVTAMNLLPMGQLDGGHLVYALIGKRHRSFSVLMAVILVVMGLLTWPGWFVWAALISILGMRHPPVDNEYLPMDKRRRATTACAAAVFILTFIPTPFYII